MAACLLRFPMRNCCQKLQKLEVTKTFGIGTYLAVPIILLNGLTFGTLCCISHQLRTALGNRQVDALRLIAEKVVIKLQKESRYIRLELSHQNCCVVGKALKICNITHG